MYGDLPRHQIPSALRLVAAQFRSRLGGGAIRHRPTSETWSALEYAAHVRDVLTVQRERIGLALRFDSPAFESMRAEQRAIELRYNEDDPEHVTREIERASEQLAGLLADLTDHEWTRTGIYNWPTRAQRDITWIARHTVHELAHHLMDISRSVEPTPTAASG